MSDYTYRAVSLDGSGRFAGPWEPGERAQITDPSQWREEWFKNGAWRPVPEEVTPDAQTSNHGWAIWHLTEAQKAGPDAATHVAMAQARATLALAAELGARRGVDPNGPTVWPVPDWDRDDE